MPYPWFEDPFNGQGDLFIDRPDKCVYICEVSPGVMAQHTQTVCDPALDANKELYKESDGKRWGDGRVVASIPLPIYYDKIAPAKKAGDDTYIKRFLNDPDNRAFRTFKGTI